MDLLVTNKEELIRDVIINGNIGCSDHETVEFEIQRGARKEIAEHRRADFRLFKELVGGITAYLKCERNSGKLMGL